VDFKTSEEDELTEGSTEFVLSRKLSWSLLDLMLEMQSYRVDKQTNKAKAHKINLQGKQSLKFSIQVVNNREASAAKLAKCILLHAYSRTTAASSCASTNKNFLAYTFFIRTIL